MTIKWDREAVLVILMAFAIIFAAFYYGHQYFVAPLKEEAETVAQIAEGQRALVADYEPTEANLTEYESRAEDTEVFLPHGDKATEALITLQEHAQANNVSISSMTRTADGTALTDMPSGFVESTYTIEVTSSVPAGMRRLIDELMNEERIWDVHSFSYRKAGDESYVGSLTIDLPYYSAAVIAATADE